MKILGAGAFEVTAYKELNNFKDTVKGKARLGVAAYAEALLVIPKVLATNSGFDAQVKTKNLAFIILFHESIKLHCNETIYYSNW